MQLTESLTMAISKPCLYEKCIVKCFVSEISKGGCLLYKKERRLIGIFNWIEDYTLVSGRIWFFYLKLQTCSLSKGCKNIFSAFKECLSVSLPPSRKITKTSKVQMFRKILPWGLKPNTINSLLKAFISPTRWKTWQAYLF